MTPTVVSLTAGADLQKQQWDVSRKLLASPPESVSIYDGTLPSPELGPLMMAQTPTQAPLPAPTAVVKSAGATCGRGCIAGEKSPTLAAAAAAATAAAKTK